MDTISAFLMGEKNRDNPRKVFNWDLAAKLIRDRKPNQASAGLSGDWEYTGGVIYNEGKPVLDDYTYLSSTWATPELDMDGEVISCWLPESETLWDSGTKWPESALRILEGDFQPEFVI